MVTHGSERVKSEDFESHSLINERNCNNLVFSAFSPCLESLQLHMRSCSSCLILSTAVLTGKKLLLTTAIHFKQKGGGGGGGGGKERYQLEMLFDLKPKFSELELTEVYGRYC